MIWEKPLMTVVMQAPGDIVRTSIDQEDKGDEGWVN